MRRQEQGHIPNMFCLYSPPPPAPSGTDMQAEAAGSAWQHFIKFCAKVLLKQIRATATLPSQRRLTAGQGCQSNVPLHFGLNFLPCCCLPLPVLFSFLAFLLVHFLWQAKVKSSRFLLTFAQHTQHKAQMQQFPDCCQSRHTDCQPATPR